MTAVPIVFVPALGSDERLWQPVVDRLDPAHDRAFVLRGEGSSLAEIADSIFAQAPDQFVLVGISMGGYIALEMALRHSPRVTALGLCNTSAIAAPADRRQNSIDLIDLVRAGGFEDAIARTSRGVAPGNPEVSQIAAEMALDLGAKIFIDQQRAVLERRDRVAELPGLDIPTIVIGGATDQITPPELSEQLAYRIPNATLHILPDCGHLSPLEQPDAVADLLRRWLEDLA